MTELVGLLGDPQRACPVIHVTGTNGKTSTARALTTVLVAKGLSVGTFTSPHLERLNERLTANGVPVDDETWRELTAAARAINVLVEPPGPKSA